MVCGVGNGPRTYSWFGAKLCIWGIYIDNGVCSQATWFGRVSQFFMVFMIFLGLWGQKWTVCFSMNDEGDFLVLLSAQCVRL